MSHIAKKLREARRVNVSVGDLTFVLRRPTDLEFMELRGSSSGERLLQFLVDWKNVKDSDIIEQGDPHPVPFDADDAREWLSDRPDLFAAISRGLLEAYNQHSRDLEAKLENLTAGSNPQPTQAASSHPNSLTTSG